MEAKTEVLADPLTIGQSNALRGPSRTIGLPLVVFLVFFAAAVSAVVVQRRVQSVPKPATADIEFYNDMSTHHWQVIQMARIYLHRGEDWFLEHIAFEIMTSQSGDIRVMNQALIDWGETGDDQRAMAWMGMAVPQDEQPGMASSQEMKSLGMAFGDDLDDQFTRLVIRHHAGGLHMASAAEDAAELESVRNAAGAMAKAQSSEIVELNQWRISADLAVVETVDLTG